jgi:hypothetical protein
MADDERLVRFELLGQEFSFYTAADEKEMSAILALVREQIEDGPHLPRGTVPASKIAMMACLKMASKYIQLEKEFESYRSDSKSCFSRLTRKIEDNLTGE